MPGGHELHEGQEKEGEEEGRTQAHGQGQGHQVKVQVYWSSPVAEYLNQKQLYYYRVLQIGAQ